MILINSKESNLLLDNFKRRFVVYEYDPKKQKVCRLIWANLNCKGVVLPTDEFEKIPIVSSAEVYFYSERDKKMYTAKFKEIVDYINRLEPWEEIDAEIFDDLLRWYICVTHEDFCITYGLS